MDNSIKAERTTPVLYLVVPCYNEEEVIERSAQVLGGKLRRLQQAGRIAPGSKVMFVNDGSRDDTLRLIRCSRWSACPAITGIRARFWPA